MIVSLFVFHLHPRCPRPQWICETRAYGGYPDAGPNLELPKWVFRFPGTNQDGSRLASPAQHLF